MPPNSEKKVKATLFLPKKRRDMIRESGLSVEKFFDRVLDKYDYYSIDNWDNGIFWIQKYRVGVFLADTINYCFSLFEDRKIYEAGQEMGRRARITLKYEEGDSERNNSISKIMEDLNSLFGWGSFSVEDNTIVLRQPLFTSPYFIYGFLETLLKETLNIVESTNNRIVFELQQNKTAITHSESALLDLLYQYQLKLEEAKTIQEIAKATVTTISNSMVYNTIDFGVIDKEGAFKFIFTIPKDLPPPPDWSISLDETGVTYRMTKIGRTDFIKEDRSVEPENEAPIIRTELMIPIKKQGEIVAFIYVQSNRLNPFRYREHRILETLAMNVASSLFRIQSEN
jgi:hypothetical protein